MPTERWLDLAQAISILKISFSDFVISFFVNSSWLSKRAGKYGKQIRMDMRSLNVTFDEFLLVILQLCTELPIPEAEHQAVIPV
jgi:hypothetical protein